MEIRIELLTYDNGVKNVDEIALLMGDLDKTYDREFCMKKTEDLLSFIVDGSAIVAAAFVGDRLIGYAWGYLRRVKKLRIHVTQLVVNSKYRSMGLGKQLLELLQDECKKHGCDGLELNVAGNNPGAQKFYLNNGFVCESMFLSKDVD